MDETDIRVTGEWRSLARAVATHGQTSAVLWTAPRDQEAARRLLKQAIRRHGVPEKSTIDGSAANAAAIQHDHQEHGTLIEIRQITYLHNRVEPDHRGVKRVTRPRLGCKSFEATQATRVGIELMHMLKKGQLVGETRAAGLTPAEPFYALVASPLPQQGSLDHPSNFATYMDPPPVSRDGRTVTRKRADAGIYPAC
jgi:transposase-like protein